MNTKKIKLPEIPEKDIFQGLLIKYQKELLIGENTYISTDIVAGQQEYTIPEDIKVLAVYFRIK